MATSYNCAIGAMCSYWAALVTSYGYTTCSTTVATQLSRTEQSSGGAAATCFTMVLGMVLRDKGGVFKALKK